MIITKEMFDEFVESAENHTILWTDTLALIGVTVGDVPDVDVIEAQAAEIARLREALLDSIMDNCWNAYNVGIVKAGQWMDGGMSDAEWLRQEIGLSDGWHNVEKIRLAIPHVAAALLARAALAQETQS